MRKALMSFVLAATAMTPVAAWAQDGRGDRGRHRAEPTEARSERTERQAERREARQQRVEQRAERREARQQTPVQVQAQPALQGRAFNRRGERNLERAGNSGGSVSQPQPGVRAFNRRGERNLERGGDGAIEQNRREWRQERREDRRESRQDRREDRRDWRQDRRESRRDWSRSWNRQSWRNDRRYDWQSWRFRNRSLFRSSYYSPFRNHRYSRFSIGLFLQPLFYSQNYWLSDPWQYRLPYAPPGTQWVRYYNDVLLVDVYSGEVVDVIYDFFW